MPDVCLILILSVWISLSDSAVLINWDSLRLFETTMFFNSCSDSIDIPANDEQRVFIHLLDFYKGQTTIFYNLLVCLK